MSARTHATKTYARVRTFRGRGRDVSLALPVGDVAAYLSVPVEGRRGPGVILVHEWWGLVDHIRHVADRLATEGFTALAVDVYEGRQATEPSKAEKLAMALDIGKAMRLLSASIDWLLTADVTSGEKAGAIGYCLGGGLVATLAARREDLGAAITYYGIEELDAAARARIKAPILVHFAEHDIPLDEATAWVSSLRRYGVAIMSHVYPGAQHGFFNDTRPSVYDPVAAGRSWARTVRFLHRHLGDGPGSD